VDVIAALKLNALSIHFNDDQSWPLYIQSYPNLSFLGAYSNHSHTYTPSMMADLVSFAEVRGVRILPEFDSPSHFGTLGSSYPQFAATTKDGGACLVDPSREEVYEFLTAVWTDIAALFPDAQFRIGGDEFQSCWNDCPSVMSWIAKEFGVNGTIYDAYHYYIRRVIGIMRSLGKTSMVRRIIIINNTLTHTHTRGPYPKNLQQQQQQQLSHIPLTVYRGRLGWMWRAFQTSGIMRRGREIIQM